MLCWVSCYRQGSWLILSDFKEPSGTAVNTVGWLISLHCEDGLCTVELPPLGWAGLPVAKAPGRAPLHPAPWGRRAGPSFSLPKSWKVVP